MKFLGCGSAFAPMFGNTSAYISIDKNLILFDCGELVFKEVYEEKLLQIYENIHICITHMHADHVGSLGSLISYAYYVLNKKVIVNYPDELICNYLDLIGIDRRAYLFQSEVKMTFGIKLEAVPVKHADNMKCFAYLIETLDEKVYYSGDSYEIPEEILQTFLSGKIDKIYQDTTEFVTPRKSHFPLPLLEEVIPENYRSKVYCMHFNSDFSEKIRLAGFSSVLDLVK